MITGEASIGLIGQPRENYEPAEAGFLFLLGLW